jgi:DNA-binding beta-propeller fold protein YncE
LRSLPEWKPIVDRIAASRSREGSPVVAFSLAERDFVAEDIVWDSVHGRFLVSSIRHRMVVSATRDGRVRDFIAGDAPDRWAMLALAVDLRRNRLWATTYVVPQMSGYVPADSGRAAVLVFDLTNGTLRKRYDLPRDGAHEPGDIAVARNGDVFISDGRSTVISVIRNGSGVVSALVSAGEFMSPQGPAIAPDGRHLYVADYARGLAEVDRRTGAVRWLKHPANAALNGIDGLTLVTANRLLAVQNGVTPNRILSVDLDPIAGEITAVHVVARDTGIIREPTHAALVGDDLWFIANGGFSEFGDGVTPSPRLAPPAIMRLRVRKGIR